VVDVVALGLEFLPVLHNHSLMCSCLVPMKEIPSLQYFSVASPPDATLIIYNVNILAYVFVLCD
jgi:hypothetical protein